MSGNVIKSPGLGRGLTNTIYRPPGSRLELLESIARSYFVVNNAVVAGSPREWRCGNAMVIEFTTPIHVLTGCIREGLLICACKLNFALRKLVCKTFSIDASYSRSLFPRDINSRFTKLYRQLWNRTKRNVSVRSPGRVARARCFGRVIE